MVCVAGMHVHALSSAASRRRTKRRAMCCAQKHPSPLPTKKEDTPPPTHTHNPSPVQQPRKHPPRNRGQSAAHLLPRAGAPFGLGFLAGLPVLRSLSDGAAMRASIYTPFVSVDEDAGVVGIEWNGISVRSLSGAARLLRRCGTESESGGDLLGKKHPEPSVGILKCR